MFILDSTFNIWALALLAGVTTSQQRPSSTDLAQTALMILQQGQRPGGIEVDNGCTSEPQPIAALKRAAIEDQLNELQTISESTHWKAVSAGYIVQITDSSATSLMQIRLPAITLKGGSVKIRTDQLLEKREIQDEIERTHLKLFATPIGFSSLAAHEQHPHDLQLPAATFAEDLERIAEAEGSAVWVYSAAYCKGELVGRIIWH